MKIQLKGNGSGGTEIKLDFHLVMRKLEHANERLRELELPKPKNTYGKNDLKFTNEWLEREEMIHQFFKQYVETVKKILQIRKKMLRS
ncbi:hypothetical protein GMD78_03380 [Ornithinibacillus sp. L9]|uniref:Uncharacterized protein n=1 Tax=Ornithinibacillus caprae TaxID=2678566 RepID=A0A6N8FCQ4_9BACI|nr:DUF5344 family protein [Ornithinibacillus caprae]MUK87442.1 hypothetical protein [Ornithinibacillus caprae]